MSDFLTNIQRTEFVNASAQDIRQTAAEYGRGLDYYRARIRAINLCGFSNVLDAACGWGQWSIVLSEVNKQVMAVDLNPGGLEISKKAAQYYQRNNITFNIGDLHALPYQDETFDAIFCYGVLMYTKEDVVLRELSRLLRRGGKIYICSNGPSWPIYKILRIGLPNMDIKTMLSGIKIFTNKIFHDILPGRFSGKLTYMRKRDITGLMKKNGLKILHYGVEASFGDSGVPPLYGRFCRLPADFEAIGIK